MRVENVQVIHYAIIDSPIHVETTFPAPYHKISYVYSVGLPFVGTNPLTTVIATRDSKLKLHVNLALDTNLTLENNLCD